ncbi:hypothetical protein Tco_0324643 [Tanacetum coccineum]
MPIILGRPLLAMAHANVNIFRKSISLEVGNEKVIFKIKKTAIPIESVCAIRIEFRGTVDDEDNLDGIVDYLELKPHNGFIDIEDEAYKERMCKFLGMTYKEPSLILIKKVEVTRYMIDLGESYTKVKILEIDEMPRTNANIASVRAGLTEEIDTGGSVRNET